MGPTRALILVLLSGFGCDDDQAVAPDAALPPPDAATSFVVVTFNSGSSGGSGVVGDAYGDAEAEASDAFYGNGLAWLDYVEDARAFFAEVDADVVAFQEVFGPSGCPDVPADARAGFVCESWMAGDPSVVERVLGPEWEVACHPGRRDKCAAVHSRFGRFRDGLAGFEVDGCSRGARVARGIIDRISGPPITVVTVHGTSGLRTDEMDCRVRQIDQVFVDLGDGAPGVSGVRNIVLGDLNTDPGRTSAFDVSAARWLDFVGEGHPFRFVSEVGSGVAPTYGGILNIDHVAADAFEGDCWAAGVTPGHPAVHDAGFFDHRPIVCEIAPK